MTQMFPAAARAAATHPLAGVEPIPHAADAARTLLVHLEQGRKIDAPILRDAMEIASGGSDAEGAWDWKLAYDACEAATILFLRKYGKVLLRKAGSPTSALPLFTKITDLLPTHTRRSEEGQAFQQFSTPIPLGFVAATAAAITPQDAVLEPSAGSGLLAILAEIAGGRLILNELADARADLLSSLFPAIPVIRGGAQDTINNAGQQIIQRQLQVSPTLTIRPGFPVRVVVTRDLVLEPYAG